MLQLTPPKTATFLISFALAAIAASIHYADVQIPYTHSGFSILFRRLCRASRGQFA
jgi:hypothetical protein